MGEKEISAMCNKGEEWEKNLPFLNRTKRLSLTLARGVGKSAQISQEKPENSKNGDVEAEGGMTKKNFLNPLARKT